MNKAEIIMMLVGYNMMALSSMACSMIWEKVK
jgi:hypothetical protein